MTENIPAGDFVFSPSADAPEGADFSLVITEDCMSPYIKPGQTVYVSASGPLSEFEPGLFYYRGRVLCRQWCEDITGTLHLLAADPGRPEANLSLDAEERKACLCLGKVILAETPPPPAYF